MSSKSAATLSTFASGLTSETAFDVLAVARRLKAQGKDVIELQIGDSPFASTKSALAAGIQAIKDHATHYCPSLGLPSFREIIAANYRREFGIDIGPENVVVGPGAKVFEQFFCEAVLDPGDAVLVFTPHFPTYGPNIERRRATGLQPTAAGERVPPRPQRCRAVCEDNSACQSDLPQFPAQPHGRSGN